jgi:hypothetical protein
LGTSNMKVLRRCGPNTKEGLPDMYTGGGFYRHLHTAALERLCMMKLSGEVTAGLRKSYAARSDMQLKLGRAYQT